MDASPTAAAAATASKATRLAARPSAPVETSRVYISTLARVYDAVAISTSRSATLKSAKGKTIPRVPVSRVGSLKLQMQTDQSTLQR